MIARFCLVALTILYTTVASATTFEVSVDPAIGDKPLTGRLTVYVLHDTLLRLRHVDPVGNVFYSPPRPLYGIDLVNLLPGTAVRVDDNADWFLFKPSELPPGKYHAQAVLDMHRDNSEWSREPGNLFSKPVAFTVWARDDAQKVAISLDQLVMEKPDPQVEGVEVFVLRSKLLSEFHKRDVVMKAGVVFPAGFDPKRSYPAVYEVPGFGGDYRDAFGRPARIARQDSNSARRQLAQNVFYITLDPESGNGHTLFCDSDVNGPWGRALTEELIPALEAKYNLIAQPSARLLRGHSSGGWSTLWLATEYPSVFGATWSSSPDPVDFHRFERANIYDTDNFFYNAGKPIPSYRNGRKIILDVFEENGMEQIIGPGNTSGQQWDSWMSCWGTRDANGNATALYDAKTGIINRTEAETYKRFDITDRLRNNPGKYGQIFRENVRIICGAEDDFYLNEAVELLQTAISKLRGTGAFGSWHGYVKIVPGAGHGSVFGSKEMQAIPGEMLEHLQRCGHMPATQPAK